MLAKKTGYEIKIIIREEGITEIKKIFPNYIIIAEEGGIVRNGNSNFTWAIDLLDGAIAEKIDYSQIEKQSIVASNGIIHEKFAKIIGDSK